MEREELDLLFFFLFRPCCVDWCSLLRYLPTTLLNRATTRATTRSDISCAIHQSPALACATATMTALDNTNVFVMQVILTGVVPFVWKRLGGQLWDYVVQRNLVFPAIACVAAPLVTCIAFFVARREAVCVDHPEFCQRDDVVVLTSAALSAWSPFQYALAGVHFVDYLTRGVLGYFFATVGGLAASTVANVQGASSALEYAVWLVTSVLLRWISLALCLAMLMVAFVYLRSTTGNGSCRLCIERTKDYILSHASYRVVGSGLFMLLTVLGWWAGPTDDVAATSDAAVNELRVDILVFKTLYTTRWECADCEEGVVNLASVTARIEDLKKEKASLDVESQKMRVEAEEIASHGKEVAKQTHNVHAAVVAREKADALLVQAERLEAGALLLPQQWSDLELYQHELQQMLELAQSLSHRVQTTVSSLYKVRDWNIDHDRFSEAKLVDDVATELSTALGDMVSMMLGR
eukprot:INCI19132.27.p1 GENE.INCI19132.27~~INCI19132.27.p1  ORF type:complete len:465 (+),score=66.78 INCI19132.27:490-1884(+)